MIYPIGESAARVRKISHLTVRTCRKRKSDLVPVPPAEIALVEEAT